jgi:hypothetical protein
VCSVRGLHRAFPPPDPPVYVRPQLKPSHGICCFTTMTFGAHRGADQGAGRSTSGQDLLHLLGGSTSTSPMSTAGLPQLPELRSTRPGRYSVVPDLHWHFRAGIFFPEPSLAFPGPALVGPGRHISVSAGICLFLAGIRFSWPVFASVGQDGPFSGLSRPACGRPGPIPATPRFSPHLGRASASAAAGRSQASSSSHPHPGPFRA